MDPFDESDLCECTKPDEADNPHRHVRDNECRKWEELLRASRDESPVDTSGEEWLDTNRMQNNRGQWVPAIPEPLFLSFGRTRCDCGEKFWSRRRYREHFALIHVLGVSP